MKKMALSLIFVIAVVSCSDEQEVKNISVQEAQRLLENASTYLIDVRTIAEYVLVGHPEMAYNIPYSFWNEREQKFEQNENFFHDIKAQFKLKDTLIFICRSGRRSLKAAKLAQKKRFENIFNLEHGFEGDKDIQGYRTLNGWKNSEIAYTYELDEKLTYKFR